MRLGLVGACVAAFMSLWPLSAMAQGVTINVIHERSQGVVRVNGVPVHYFASKPPFDGPATNAFNIGYWAVEGDNTVTVEAAPVPGQSGATTKVMLVEEPSDPPILEKVIEGSGRVDHVVSLEGLPPWGWIEGEAYSGPDDTLIAAVEALHKAYAARNLDAIFALSEAAIADMTVIAGPMPPEARAELQEILAKGQLAALPAGMKVERYYDNRLFVVATADSRAPVEVRDPSAPEMLVESGRYWVRKGGKWSVVRW